MQVKTLLLCVAMALPLIAPAQFDLGGFRLAEQARYSFHLTHYPFSVLRSKNGHLDGYPYLFIGYITSDLNDLTFSI